VDFHPEFDDFFFQLIVALHAKTPRVFPHLFRHTCITNWLSAGVPVETVAVLVGHSSSKITMKHYSHWIKSRQDNLEAEVKKSWAQTGTVGVQSD
jgi:integrase